MRKSRAEKSRKIEIHNIILNFSTLDFFIRKIKEWKIQNSFCHSLPYFSIYPGPRYISFTLKTLCWFHTEIMTLKSWFAYFFTRFILGEWNIKPKSIFLLKTVWKKEVRYTYRSINIWYGRWSRSTFWCSCGIKN